MLNLNYNIIGSLQQKVERQGAVYSVRNDPYSASIVVAVPGALFFDGDYTNQFGMTTAFDDISAYVRGNGVEVGTNLPTYVTTTGSFANAYPTSSLIKWADQHYNSSVYFEGTASLTVDKIWAAKEGANLSISKDFAIEMWAAWPVTASVSGSDWTPNRIFSWKYDPSANTGAYFYQPWGGDANNGGAPRIVSGSSRFVLVKGVNEFIATGSNNIQINPYQFNHYAVSYTSTSSIDPILDRTLRMYINGQIVSTFQTNAVELNQDVTELLQIFGAIDVGDIQGYYGTPAYFNDYRMYNGTNKNYTSSLISTPQSMVTWG
jgi:hypothetical protein